MIVQHPETKRIVCDGNRVLPPDIYRYRCCVHGCDHAVVGKLLRVTGVVLEHPCMPTLDILHKKLRRRAKQAVDAHTKIYRVRERCHTCHAVVRDKRVVHKADVVVLYGLLVFTLVPYRVIIALNLLKDFRPARQTVELALGLVEYTVCFNVCDLQQKIHITLQPEIRVLCTRHKLRYVYPLTVLTKRCPACNVLHGIEDIPSARWRLTSPPAWEHFDCWAVPWKTPVHLKPNALTLPADMGCCVFYNPHRQVLPDCMESTSLVALDDLPHHAPTHFAAVQPVYEICGVCTQQKFVATTIRCAVCRTILAENARLIDTSTYCPQCSHEIFSFQYPEYGPPTDEQLVLIRLLENRARMEAFAWDRARNPPPALTLVRQCSECSNQPLRKWTFELPNDIFLCVHCTKKCVQCNNVLPKNSDYHKCALCRQRRATYKNTALDALDPRHGRFTFDEQAFY